MTMRSKLFGIAFGALMLAVVAGVGAWYFLLRNDSPPPVSLQSALSAASMASTASPSAGAEAGDAGGAALTGEWTVVTSGASFVGYRVEETLAGVGATTAVGRTLALEGSLTFDGEAITAAEVLADLTALTSDKTMRDNALRMQALESATYPEAVFVLTSPIAIDELPANGETVTQTVEGELTLHGVTNAIEFEVQGVLQDGQLVVVGSTEVVFADYGIAQPRSAAVLSIEDHGTLELQLVFARAA